MKRALLIGAILLTAFLTNRFIPKKSVEIPKQATSSMVVRVTKVIDGDTIELDGGKRVRYIGMDTPELETNACFAREAAAENKKLVEGKMVRLEGDTNDTDTYNRLLRYVYVNNIFVNEVLVREGFARAEPIKPDVRYAKEFFAAEGEAKLNKRGLWNTCQL